MKSDQIHSLKCNGLFSVFFSTIATTILLASFKFLTSADVILTTETHLSSTSGFRTSYSSTWCILSKSLSQNGNIDYSVW